MVISQPQNLLLAQYVKNQLETELLKLGLQNKFFTKLRIVLSFFRHYAFAHQKVFELTDLTPDNLRPRTPMKTPKTLEKILEQEEERRGEAAVKEEWDPSESFSSSNGENMPVVVNEEPAEGGGGL